MAFRTAARHSCSHAAGSPLSGSSIIIAVSSLGSVASERCQAALKVFFRSDRATGTFEPLNHGPSRRGHGHVEQVLRRDWGIRGGFLPRPIGVAPCARLAPRTVVLAFSSV
jgi:hypothetical protein